MSLQSFSHPFCAASKSKKCFLCPSGWVPKAPVQSSLAGILWDIDCLNSIFFLLTSSGKQLPYKGLTLLSYLIYQAACRLQVKVNWKAQSIDFLWEEALKSLFNQQRRHFFSWLLGSSSKPWHARASPKITIYIAFETSASLLFSSLKPSHWSSKKEQTTPSESSITSIAGFVWHHQIHCVFHDLESWELIFPFTDQLLAW